MTSRSGELALRRAIGATRWSVARLVLAGNCHRQRRRRGAGDRHRRLAAAGAPVDRAGDHTDAGRRDAGLARRAVRRRLRRPVVARRRASCPAFTASDTSPAVNASTDAIHRLAGSAAMADGRCSSRKPRLSVALLVTGGILVRALRPHLASRASDTTRPGVLTAQLQLPRPRYATGPSGLPRMERIFDRVAAIPGVTASRRDHESLHARICVLCRSSKSRIRRRPTTEAPPSSSGASATQHFATMRIRLLQGRVFGRTDSLSAPPVGVVSRSFADRYWPGERCDRTPGETRLKRWMTVIGVVRRRQRRRSAAAGRATVYAAWSQTANVAFPMGLWC